MIESQREASKGSDSLRLPPPSLTGEADDSAISHLAERTTDSPPLVKRRTKHPPEKRRVCNTRTQTGTRRGAMHLAKTFRLHPGKESLTKAHSPCVCVSNDVCQ